MTSSVSTVWVALFGIGVSVLWAAISSSNEPLATTLAFHPELYHGEGKTHHFFEGWYHKLVRTRIDCGNAGVSHNDARGTNIDIDIDIDNLSMAVVPGVFYDGGNSGKNESHAFIFVTINGEKQHYYRFDLETEFRYRKLWGNENVNENDGGSSNEQYYVEIGTNRFSKHGISLDLFPRFGDDASIALEGAVRYKELSPWPIPSVRNLGAMGPVGYFLSPFLECYHDVLSFDHKLEGSLTISDRTDNNGNGDSKVEEFFDTDCCAAAVAGNDDDDNKTTCLSSRGYVEKDRGRSFPSLWIWMQTNSFRKQPQNSGTSLFFSVARIPILTANTFLGKVLPGSWAAPEFPGFTAAAWINDSNDNGDGTGVDSEADGDLRSRGSKRLIPFATWTGAYFEDLVVDDERVVAVLNSGGIGGGLWNALRSPLVESSTTSRSCPNESDCVEDDDDDNNNNNEIDSVIIRLGRFARAWIGSWFLNYDSRKLRYRLELIADRRVPHVMLYAPKTTVVESVAANASPAAAAAAAAAASRTATSRMEPFVNEALNANVRVRLYEYVSGGGDNGGEEHVRLLLDDVGDHAGLEVHQNVRYLMENLCGKPTANQFTCL